MQTGSGDLSLNLEGGLNNAGGVLVSQGRNLDLKTAILDNTAGQILHGGDGSVRINTAILNGTGGRIQAYQALDLQAAQATLDSGITTAEQLNLRTDVLHNRAGQIVQTGTGAAQVNAVVALDNQGGLIASRGEAMLKVGTLDNRGGSIQTGDTAGLVLNATGTVDNSAKGNISAGASTSLLAASVNNQQGQISAAHDLTIEAVQGIDNRLGLMAAGSNTNVNAGMLDNRAGRVAAVTGGLVVGTVNTIDNRSGKLQAAQDVRLTSSGLENAAGIVAGWAVAINTRTLQLNNTGGTLSASIEALGNLRLDATQVDNANLHLTTAVVPVKGVLGNPMNNGKESGASAGETRTAASAGLISISNEARQMELTGQTAEAAALAVNRGAGNMHTAVHKQDVQSMVDAAQAAQTIKQAALKQVTIHTDAAYKLLFVDNTNFYKVTCGGTREECLNDPSKVKMEKRSVLMKRRKLAMFWRSTVS